MYKLNILSGLESAILKLTRSRPSIPVALSYWQSFKTSYFPHTQALIRWPASNLFTGIQNERTGGLTTMSCPKWFFVCLRGGCGLLLAIRTKPAFSVYIGYNRQWEHNQNPPSQISIFITCDSIAFGVWCPVTAIRPTNVSYLLIHRIGIYQIQHVNWSNPWPKGCSANCNKEEKVFLQVYLM